MRIERKRIKGRGAHAYHLTLVDEDWQPLPGEVTMDPNHMAAINTALGAGNSLSEDNFVICTLKANGKHSVIIDKVITDSQQVLVVREQAIKRRKTIKPRKYPADAVTARYGGICGKCGTVSYDAGELILRVDNKWHWVDCPYCTGRKDPVAQHHHRQITSQGRAAVNKLHNALAESA